MGKWEKRQLIENRAKALEKTIGTGKLAQLPLAVTKKEETKRVVFASEKMSVNMTVKPKLVVPFEIWRDHLVMSQFAKGEYTTCMKITAEKDTGKYRITDYFLPTQVCTAASAEWTREGVIELVKYTKGDIEDWYGVFHIHPWKGSTVSMSGTDVNAMWKWVGASKRGVFLVSNIDAAREAWLVIETNGIKMQIPMEFEIDYVVNHEKTEELKAGLLAKVQEPVYAPLAYVPYRSPYSMDGVWEGDDAYLEALDKRYEYDPDLYWKNTLRELTQPYTPKKGVVEYEDDESRYS